MKQINVVFKSVSFNFFFFLTLDLWPLMGKKKGCLSLTYKILSIHTEGINLSLFSACNSVNVKRIQTTEMNTTLPLWEYHPKTSKP